MQKVIHAAGTALALVSAIGFVRHAISLTATIMPVSAAEVDHRYSSKKLPQAKATQQLEIVMVPGMKSIATTRSGTIAITAVDDLTRSYT